MCSIEASIAANLMHLQVMYACALARDAECERLLRPWLNYSIQKAEANPKLRADKADGSAAAAYRLRLHRAEKKAVSAGKLFRANP